MKPETRKSRRPDKANETVPFSDWVLLHGLDVETVADCLAALNVGHFDLNLSAVSAVHGFSGGCWEGPSLSEALRTLIQPAFSAAFDDQEMIGHLISTVSWGPIGPGQPPHTVSGVQDAATEIRMSWNGSTEDLICLAHETAHAIQLLLSAGSFMPPLARETCAFLGELALIAWAMTHDKELASQLLRVWRDENQRYFGDDCDLLSSALTDPEASYSYRMNYPLARASAVSMWRAGADLWKLFNAGSEAMSLLPLARIADAAGLSQNYLSPLPLANADQPAVDAYRVLGAMALLDIDFWKGQSEQRIEDYYSTLLHHLQNRTAFVALDEVRRPVGYAIWRKTDGEDTVTLRRQAAPFGDHLLLQKALERHLGQKSDVQAQHPRSARQEQRAW